MRFTTIKFAGGTILVKYQTPNADEDGWVSHEHKGTFDPGPDFLDALRSLDSLCAETHEEANIEEHPIEARAVHFYRKENSHLVQVMIPGYRRIEAQPGGYALPGIKRFLHPGPDSETDTGTLYLSPEQTQRIDHLIHETRAILPRLIKVLQGTKNQLQLAFDIRSDTGDGDLQRAFDAQPDTLEETATHTGDGEVEQPVNFFDEAAKEKAESLADTLTDYQGRILLHLAGLRAGGTQAREEHSFKGNEKRALTSLLDHGLVHNQHGRIHLSEAGWNVITVLHQRQESATPSLQP